MGLQGVRGWAKGALWGLRMLGAALSTEVTTCYYVASRTKVAAGAVCVCGSSKGGCDSRRGRCAIIAEARAARLV